MKLWPFNGSTKIAESKPQPRIEPTIQLPTSRELKAMHRRMYEGAKVDRTSADWMALSSSADSEILTSLRVLRARSRQMIRDNPYALHGVRQIVNNVIGPGIGMQPRVTSPSGELETQINDKILEEWKEWCHKKTAHTGGLLHFHDIERIVMWQIIESGEAILRLVEQPFGGGAIPLAIEVIESDRLMDQWQSARAPNGNTIKMGVEMDNWGRPVAYWFCPTHPGDYQFQSFQPSKFLRIPAEEIIHVYLVERWPQTRGVPWFHASLRRLRNSDRYEDSELIAARASANIVGFVETPDIHPLPGEDGNEKGDNQRILDTEPGQFQTLLPGEKFTGFAPSRPNAALEPFMRYLLRSVAVGIGVSYSGFSGDYSQHSYSSLRMEALSDRDLYRIVQVWIIRNMRKEIQNRWLDAAVLAGRASLPGYYADSRRYQKCKFKPRGWTWIDPREIKYMTGAVRSGFTTVSDVINETAGGSDVDDVFITRRAELDLMEKLGLVFDTDPAQVDELGQEQPDIVDEPGADSNPPKNKP